MDKLLKMQADFNAAIQKLRSAQKEEKPDAEKVRNLETEIRNLASSIEAEKAIMLVDPEQRYGAGAKPVEEETRAAVVSYMRTGAQLRDMTSGQTTGGDTGGYLIPEEWENQILEKQRIDFVMRRLANVQTSRGDTHIPVADDYGASTWIGEGGAYGESDGTLGEKRMKAYKVGRICKVSDELLHDNTYNIEQWLVNAFAYTNGLAMETAYISGDGNEKPSGFLPNATPVAAGGAALDYDDLIAMFANLKSGYYANATWLMNVKTLAAIMKLQDGGGSYLYRPFEPKTSTDPLGQILGKPVMLSELMPDVGSGAKPIAFGDFKRYRIHDRTGFEILRDPYTYSANGFVGFRGSQRTDGALLVPEAIQALTFA